MKNAKQSRTEIQTRFKWKISNLFILHNCTKTIINKQLKFKLIWKSFFVLHSGQSGFSVFKAKEWKTIFIFSINRIEHMPANAFDRILSDNFKSIIYRKTDFFFLIFRSICWLWIYNGKFQFVPFYGKGM